MFSAIAERVVRVDAHAREDVAVEFLWAIRDRVADADFAGRRRVPIPLKRRGLGWADERLRSIPGRMAREAGVYRRSAAGDVCRVSAVRTDVEELEGK